MNRLSYHLRQESIGTGLLFIAISLLLFIFPLLSEDPGTNNTGMFFVNHILTAVFFLIICFKGQVFIRNESFSPAFSCLTLALISAFALNREMAVFETTVVWFMVLLYIFCINFLCFEIVPFHSRLKHVQLFIAGIAFAGFAYLSIYLLPIMPVSMLLALVLGISLHTFVPLLFCIYILLLIRRCAVREGQRITWFYIGLGSAALVVIIYSICWRLKVEELNKISDNTSALSKNGLPTWINAARQIPAHDFTGLVLRSGFNYVTADKSSNSTFWRGLPGRNFGDRIYHDPLIMTASFFSPGLHFREEERVKILESLFDAGHQAEQRLWHGTELVTDHVATTTTIWPKLRLCYTEKTLRVKNTNHSRSGPQEAIYTFHLSEGAVVSSLSLWINGIEEKGILTTKEKAEKAYNTIVGVESRDPSVVHWREGNTVSVRVFPVQGNTPRTFKIGISAPLLLKGDRVQFSDFYFEGPKAAGATAEHLVTFATAPSSVAFSRKFSTSGSTAHRFTYSGKYHPDLEITMKATAIADDAFVFNGNEYKVIPYSPFRTIAPASNLYVDLDATWTAEELDFILQNPGHRKVYGINALQKPVEITAQNKSAFFKASRRNRFSLFPFHVINDPEAAIVITKGSAEGPGYSAIKNSDQHLALQQYFSNGRQVKLFHFGHQLSPYLETLKLFRAFRYERGTLKDLQALLVAGRFDAGKEDSTIVFAERSGIAFTKQPQLSLEKKGAPDHLARLFAYNYMMSAGGPALLAGSDLHPALVQTAQEAHIVSPVSSLVVLETQEDYKRFDIEASKKSLQNATQHSKGAVPEPHEWALIIAVVLVALYMRFASFLPKLQRK